MNLRKNPVKEDRSRTGELTDASYWDRHWQSCNDVRVIRDSDGFFGRDGILMRVIREKAAGIGPHSRIVELGGGSSYRLLTLAKWTGAGATAIDYSQEGIDTLEAIFAVNGCKVETELGDVLAWQPTEGLFDLVVHWGLLEHFADPAPIIQRSADLLKPGGVLLFSMPNMDAWGARIWRKRSPGNWSKHLYHPDSAIADACRAAGFEQPGVFFFGYPLVHITEWESTDLLSRICSRVLAKAALATAAIGWLFPVYHRGVRQISVERGFVARKRAGT
jgi:SAM-dependent methyltransferase